MRAAKRSENRLTFDLAQDTKRGSKVTEVNDIAVIGYDANGKPHVAREKRIFQTTSALQQLHWMFPNDVAGRAWRAMASLLRR